MSFPRVTQGTQKKKRIWVLPLGRASGWNNWIKSRVSHRSHLLTRLSFAMTIISSKNTVQWKGLCSKVTRHLASLILLTKYFPFFGGYFIKCLTAIEKQLPFFFSFGKQIIIIITLRIVLYSKLSYYSDKCIKPGLLICSDVWFPC